MRYLRFVKKLVSNVKEIREEQGIQQQVLADKVGVSRQTIYHLEKGTYNPKLTLSLDLSRELGKSIEELFHYEPVIYDVIGKATMDQIETINQKLDVTYDKLKTLRDIKEDQLLNEFSEEQLIKISKILGYDLKDLFEKE